MTWGPTDIESPTTMQTEESEEECERDDLFYFETVVFKVENTLFRVPRSGLDVEGTIFETMFTLPSPQENDGCREGSTDKNPIILNEISKVYFRGFLRSIYRFTATPLTYEELAGAMQLATMWEFSELRERLIDESSPFIKERPIHENILLARVCKVKQWLIDAYKSLVLDKTGSDLLGLGNNGVDASTIAKLFYIREQLKPQIGNSTISTVSYSYCSYCQNHRNFNHVVLDPQQVLNI
ncbi:hypothetical protein BJ912DRAFT_314742 [Pholiota molesta]|nr:hypothetical protein BJ912DRAFT_314742 [Pholiota molesta]